MKNRLLVAVGIIYLMLGGGWLYLGYDKYQSATSENTEDQLVSIVEQYPNAQDDGTLKAVSDFLKKRKAEDIKSAKFSFIASGLFGLSGIFILLRVVRRKPVDEISLRADSDTISKE